MLMLKIREKYMKSFFLEIKITRKSQQSSESNKHYLSAVTANNFGSNMGSDEKCKHLMESKFLHTGQVKN